MPFETGYLQRNYSIGTRRRIYTRNIDTVRADIEGKACRRIILEALSGYSIPRSTRRTELAFVSRGKSKKFKLVMSPIRSILRIRSIIWYQNAFEF